MRLNLYQALRRLRWFRDPRLIWVDAICINQSDVDEKSQQIPLMGRIYRNAASVLVWLGEEAETSSAAFTLMENIYDSMRCDGEESRAELARNFTEGAEEGSPLNSHHSGREVLAGKSSNSTLRNSWGRLEHAMTTLVDRVFSRRNGSTSEPVFSKYLTMNETSDPTLLSMTHTRTNIPPRNHKSWTDLRALIDRAWFTRV